MLPAWILVPAYLCVVVCSYGEVQPLELSGTCTSASWYPSGQQFQSNAYPFRVSLRGAAWWLHVDNLSGTHTIKGGVDSSDLVYDGHDLFTVGHVPDPAAAIEMWKRSKGVNLEAFNTVAIAAPGPFPGFATPVERMLWLAFCTSGYPPLTATNLPPLDDQLAATNVANVEANYFPTGPLPLKRLSVSVRGMLIRNPKRPGERLLARLPGPLTNGYVTLEYQVTSQTNVGGGVTIPQHVLVSWFGPNLSAVPPRRYTCTKQEIDVAEVRQQAEPIAAPALPGTANILDARFTDKSGRPFHYQETNASWVARADSNALRSLEAKRRVPLVKGPAPRTHQGWYAWVVLSVFLAPIPFFARGLVRRLRTRWSTTEK